MGTTCTDVHAPLSGRSYSFRRTLQYKAAVTSALCLINTYTENLRIHNGNKVKERNNENYKLSDLLHTITWYLYVDMFPLGW